MQIKLFLLSLTFLLIFSGCGQIEDESAGTIEYENENYESNQNNTCYSDQENSAGCFGEKQKFGDEYIDNGVWSLYGKSDNYILYYDKYILGYQLISDGTVKQRKDTQAYYFSAVMAWGVNNDGSKLTINPVNSFTITSKLTGSCYKVTATNGDTYRMCNEDTIDDNTASNSSGYYGSELKFGNNTYGDYTVVGSWNINGASIDLDENGTTSTGGEWGLSSDAKRLSVDGIDYLAYRYPDNDNLEVFIMQGDYAIDKVILEKL